MDTVDQIVDSIPETVSCDIWPFLMEEGREYPLAIKATVGHRDIICYLNGTYRSGNMHLDKSSITSGEDIKSVSIAELLKMENTH